MAIAGHQHVNRLSWCSTESPAFDDDRELLLYYPLSPLIFPNNSLISDQTAPDPLFNSNYSPSLSSSNYMQQALMNASLLQEACDCGDNNMSLILYCPPPWNSCGKVLQFECNLLPDDDIVNASLHNLPDLSGLDVRVFNEFIDSIDSCSTPVPADVCPKSSDSLTIDLPGLVDRQARSACMSSSVSCSSALASHGEIKEVISWADSNQPKKQRRSQLSCAGDNGKLAHTTAALIESASWADSISPRSNVASPMQAIASSPATPQPRINSTVQAAKTSIQDNGDTRDRESSCKVTLCVKTDTLNLLDGYTWRKYGEKRIRNQNFTRSYFRCAENGCGVMKRTERCSIRQENVLFTYLGRHNHHTSLSTDQEIILKSLD